jgi:hypothetical protein
MPNVNSIGFLGTSAANDSGLEQRLDKGVDKYDLVETADSGNMPQEFKTLPGSMVAGNGTL